MTRFVSYTLVLGMAVGAAAQSKPPATPAESLRQTFHYINEKIVVMAKDFPEENYDFKLKPEMRTYREVIVHIASGNMYAAKAGRGEKVKWDELDAKDYKTKGDCVALIEKWVSASEAAEKEHPLGPQGSLEPFLGVLQHSSEHYGLLVAYYRANGLVPPESRPKK